MTLRLPTLLILGALAVPLGASQASAASLPADSTAILSGAPSLLDTLPSPAGRTRLAGDALSRDGAVVVFSSESDGLTTADDDTVENVYAKDRATGAVVLVSRRTGAAGAPADRDCDDGAVSDDGKRVAFVCAGPLDPADTNGQEDVYVRDLVSSTTILVSRGDADGAVGNQPSFDPALSADGRFVAFSSLAKNLDADATNGPLMVYRTDLETKTTRVVSRPTAGPLLLQGEGASISDDGTRIAFSTNTDAAGGDTNVVRDVYLRDMVAGTTTLVSRADGDGAVGNGPSYAPAIAGDGTAVAFESQANSFDPAADPDKEPDVYRRGLAGKVTALVSENANGDKGQASQAPSIDTLGQVVAFRSAATQLDPADPDAAPDAYAKNVVTNSLQVISRADGAAGAVANAARGPVAVSGDGKRFAFALEDGRIVPDVDPLQPTVALRDLAGTAPATASVARPAGTAPFRNEGGAATPAVLSDDGRFAAFVSQAPGLGLPAGTVRGVFVRDRVTGGVTLASRADGPTGALIVPDNDPPAISGDGRRVAWSVVDGPDRGVWVRDLAAGRTFLASRADDPAGTPANGRSNDPSLDADGDRVAFSTLATNMKNGDTDADYDVHVRDLAAERTRLASSDAAGKPGDNPSFEGDLNGAGTRVAFRSYATNLGDGDTDPIIDAHLKDLETGDVRLLSAEPGGPKGNASVTGLSIDASGDRVAFAVSATNLLGQTSGNVMVLVRDLAGGTLTLASRADGADGAAADRDASAPVISPDGGSVGFSTFATNLDPGAPNGVAHAYVRDLAAGRTTLASRRNSGERVADQVVLQDINTGAGCVSFGTGDAAVGERVDTRQAYLRVLGADCARGGAGGGGDGGDGGNGGDGNDGGARPDDGGVRDQPDRIAPVLTRVSLRPAVLRMARGRVARKPSVMAFRSSEPGRLTLRIRRIGKGRAFAKSVRGTARAGANRRRLNGRVGRRLLRPGRYRLTLTVRDAAGNDSKPVARRLTVVRSRSRAR